MDNLTKGAELYTGVEAINVVSDKLTDMVSQDEGIVGGLVCFNVFDTPDFICTELKVRGHANPIQSDMSFTARYAMNKDGATEETVGEYCDKLILQAILFSDFGSVQPISEHQMAVQLKKRGRKPESRVTRLVTIGGGKDV